MEMLVVYLTKFNNMLNIPATQFFLIALGVSILIRIALRFVKITNYSTSVSIIFILILTLYSSPLSIMQLLVFVMGSYILTKKILKIDDNLLSLVIGIIASIQVFVLIGLFLNPTISFYSILLILFLQLFYKLDESIVLIRQSINHFSISINEFNIFDLWLIISTSILGSLPQYHWDSVLANLYNAKWYILNNSFAPLQESISSIFPQNAIAYYSIFYKIGEYKGLQLAYILPLIIIILLIKKLIMNFKMAAPYTTAIYAALLTPIVMFESSNGYYDLLITMLMLTGIYTLLRIVKTQVSTYCLSAAFLIGFAAGMKYFALVLMPIPLCMLYLHRDALKRSFWVVIMFSIFLSTFSLGVWAYRGFVFTGSPVYPFFQQYFPTPAYWPGNDNLEQNFMIQTTMKTLDWIKGGFVFYPVQSYLHTSQYLEATKGYPGTVYIFGMLAQLIITLYILIKIFTKKSTAPVLVVNIFLFLAYMVIGIMTRYYRYLMPFQFILFISTIISASQLISLSYHSRKIISVFCSLIIGLNLINLIEYYRYYPIDNDQLFKPDYFQGNNRSNSPINYLNQNTSSNHRVLDGSAILMPRFHLIPKTYECNWYWINGSKIVSASSYSKLVSMFDYVVTSDSPENGTNYCHIFIKSVIDDPKNTLVYSDHANYRIYKLNKEFQSNSSETK